MSPIISEDLTGKFEKFNNDRFTEITEKIDKMMVEAELAATPKFITSPNTTLAEQIAAMPPVQFSNQAQPYPIRHSLAFGDNIASMPALTYIENRPRRNRGRRNWSVKSTWDPISTDALEAYRWNPYGIRYQTMFQTQQCLKIFSFLPLCTYITPYTYIQLQKMIEKHKKI